MEQKSRRTRGFPQKTKVGGTSVPLSVLLVRHGESEANIHNVIVSDRFDPTLTDYGRQETQSLAQKWQGQPVSAIYSSPLRRTMETAQIWAETLNVATIYPDPRLHEIHLGAFDGKVIDDILRTNPEDYNQWKHNPESPPQGGEKLSAVGARMKAFLDMIASQYHEGLVIGVTHADCLKAVTLSILEAPWTSAQFLHFGNVAGVFLEYHDNRFQIHALPVIPI
ncbi:MAG: hypothetical protein C7B47_10925 [Sulfobacillus thermosulfidooxidans]|uniref:Histidine phosphatase family protein n=1 Tax=Sulfobacillus thermosulfidooxidans TaxID=28034 RepID=A0A2T2WVY9_SULTH|nr:MAG: hypothetical protein C7B47_10925 [Sulfobacillus thermosulfidooxidans]